MTLINDVAQIQAECTKCDKMLFANKGDTIVVMPLKLLNEWRLVVLCEGCYKETMEEEE